VKIRTAPETEAAGIAGRNGVVYGTTTVSVTCVKVIGAPNEDVAVNVVLDESDQSLWLAPALIDFVEHNAGATITFDGVPKTWTRDASGNWVESSRPLPYREWFRWLRGAFRKLARK
jgi:hypothetical protein